jgi:hypothetical protein
MSRNDALRYQTRLRAGERAAGGSYVGSILMANLPLREVEICARWRRQAFARVSGLSQRAAVNSQGQHITLPLRSKLMTRSLVFTGAPVGPFANTLAYSQVSPVEVAMIFCGFP